MFLVVWKYAQMHQSTFFTPPYIKKYRFKNLILVVWKYAQMLQNTFFTTSDVKKYLF
jgi:hypothetical protein